MADGYARATGKPGVCTIIAGPGVTNAATGIAQAYCDSQPMLVLSGACATRTQGKGWGAIHELADQAAVTAGFTAFSAMVRLSGRAAGVDCSCLCAVSRQPAASGASVAASGRAAGTGRGRLADRAARLPCRCPIRRRSTEAADLLAQAKRPLILVGGGAVGTREALTAIAEHIGAPVLSTNAGKGILPESHSLSLGCSIVQQGQPAGAGRRRRGAAGRLGSFGRRQLPADTRHIGRHHSHRHRSHGTDIGVFGRGAHSGRRPCRDARPVDRSRQPQADVAARGRASSGSGTSSQRNAANADRPRKAARARMEDAALSASRGRHRDGRRLADCVHRQFCDADGHGALLVLFRHLLLPWVSPCRWPSAPRSARRIGR